MIITGPETDCNNKNNLEYTNQCSEKYFLQSLLLKKNNIYMKIFFFLQKWSN